MENLERDVLAYQALTFGLKLFCERNKLYYWQGLKLAFSEIFKQDLGAKNELVEKAVNLVEQFGVASDRSLPHLPAITNSIKDEENKTPNALDKYFYPLVALELSEQIFPQIIDSKLGYDKEFTKLWNDFSHDSAQLSTTDLNVYLTSFVYLLHKYFWCLSATTSNKQYLGFSLYEQCRISAALAACFYELEKVGESNKTEDLLIIEGDISGIQKFIYNPAFNGQELQDGIARRLRGRSFYLNLLLKTLTDYLIGELKLYNFNALWATGGHFLIIAPNTQKAKDQLKNARENIQKWMWKEFRGALGLIMADVEVASSELKDFSAVRSKIADKGAKLKLQQFAIPLNFEDSAPDEAWQNPWVLKMQQAICHDTGRDMSDKDVEISKAYQEKSHQDQDEKVDENLPPRSTNSLFFDLIGRVLVRTNSLQLRRHEHWNEIDAIRKPKTTADVEDLFSGKPLMIEIPELKRHWLLTQKDKPAVKADLCLQIADHSNAEIDFLSNQNKSVAQGFEFFATAVALKQGRTSYHKQIVDFHELAKNSEGAEFLGILRMDVDNLGLIFAKGFPEKDKSIAKIANLSRMLDMFFTGYLNVLVNERNPNDQNPKAKPKLYTTYAGGDDLFIVGAWSEVVELAQNIKEKFAAYCAKNPALHISGGIALCKGKYPIGHAAEEAGELLDEKAKKVTHKNAIAFMGYGISWKDWAGVSEISNKLIKGLEEGKVSRGFIYNLIALHRQYIEPDFESEQKTKANLLLVPKFLYSLVRNVSDKDLCCDLQTMIHNQQAYLSVIAGYTALRTRERNQENMEGVN